MIKNFLSPAFSGWLLLITLVLTLGDTLAWFEATAIATLLAWLFVLLEFHRMNARQRKPILFLGIASIGFSLWAWWASGSIDIVALVSEHIKLVMLLIAVNFIRLATQLHSGTSLRGEKSFLATFTGMHFFSSVANFSSLLLIGDQIKDRKTEGTQLSPLSYILLSRGFALAIFWSPFLSMIPLVLEQVPGVEMGRVYPWAILLVVIGLFVTWLESRYRHGEELAQYQGYPISRNSLMLPVILIATLIAAHYVFPDIPMVALVSMVAVAIPLLMNYSFNGVSEGTAKLKSQITEKLPTARPEISLFLMAGFLAASVKACIVADLIPSPFTETNATIAAVVMVLIFVIANFGVHQFALVAIFAGLLEHATSTPTLIAIAYMMSVSLAMSGSIFSGLSFIVGGQYKVSNSMMLKQNLPYSLIMLVVTIIVLYVMEAVGVV